MKGPRIAHRKRLIARSRESLREEVCNGMEAAKTAAPFIETLRPGCSDPSRRQVTLGHQCLVTCQFLLELAPTDAANDRAPLLLSFLQDILGGKLANVSLRQILAERILEFQVSGQIGGGRDHLKIALDRLDAASAIRLDHLRRGQLLLGPYIVKGVHRVRYDRDAVLARAEPQSEIRSLRFSRAVPVDQQCGKW